MDLLFHTRSLGQFFFLYRMSGNNQFKKVAINEFLSMLIVRALRPNKMDVRKMKEE